METDLQGEVGATEAAGQRNSKCAGPGGRRGAGGTASGEGREGLRDSTDRSWGARPIGLTGHYQARGTANTEGSPVESRTRRPLQHPFPSRGAGIPPSLGMGSGVDCGPPAP